MIHIVLSEKQKDGLRAIAWESPCFSQRIRAVNLEIASSEEAYDINPSDVVSF